MAKKYYTRNLPLNWSRAERNGAGARRREMGCTAMKSYEQLPGIIRSMNVGGADLPRNIDSLISIYDRIITKGMNQSRFPFLAV